MIDRKELAHLKKLISYIFVTEIFYRSFNLLFMSFFFFFMSYIFTYPFFRYPEQFVGLRRTHLFILSTICFT